MLAARSVWHACRRTAAHRPDKRRGACPGTTRGTRLRALPLAARTAADTRPSCCRRARNRRRARSYGYADGGTHAQNTLSTETTEVQVYYPFHPLHGLTVQIQRRPKRGDGAAIVADRAGKRLKIPMWMLSPSSREIRLSERAVLSKEALLSLSSVLAIRTQRDHDNLQRIAVDLCQGGHREATRTDGPDDPRSPSGTRKRKRSGRSGRSDGALSRSSIPR